MGQIWFIISQLLAVTAIVLLLWYTIKPVSRHHIMLFNIAINLLWTVHYILLQAYSGAICSAFCALMVWIFSFKGKKRFLSRPIVPIFFVVFFLFGGLLTWTGAISIIPIVGNILLVAAMWQNREWTIKAICVLVAALWIVYNYMNQSPIGTVGQTLSFFANLFYVVTHRHRDAVS